MPRKVAEVSPYLKKEIHKQEVDNKEFEMLSIKLKDIKGDILEIVMDYLNHKVNIFFYIIFSIIMNESKEKR